MSTAPLTLTPLSAVACEAVLCRQAGALFATVVVKATFQLVHGETARPIAPLGLVHRDQMGAGGSLTAARETEPHVPNAGVLVTGHAYAPGGGVVPVPSMSVRLGVSRQRPLVDKTLHVFGDRTAANPSATVPFQKMPIVYERAYGGPGVWENPVGTGGPGSRTLPNIVDPKDARRPAGFGPVAGAWMPRRRMLSGADPGALEQAIFEAPRGFDWQYFQAAPADQQLDTLRGDEWILLDGMHPTLPRVQTRLPQARAQARRGTAGGAAGEAIELRADMLVIDADALVASVVWRGRFAAGSVEALRSVRVLVGLEVAGRPIDWVGGGRVQANPAPVQGETQEVNLGAILGGQLPFDGNRESALPPPSAKAAPAPLSSGTVEVDVRKILQGAVPFGETARATPAPAAAKAGGPPVAIETVMAIPALSLLAPPAVPFAPADPNKPPAEAAPNLGTSKPTPMHTGTTDINLAEVMKSVMPYREGRSREPASSVPDAPPPPPSPPPPMAAPPSFAPPASVVAVRAAAPPAVGLVGMAAVGASPELAGANDEVRAAVLERLAAGQSLEGLRLIGAALHDIDFKGASLIGLDLQKARLAGAKLQEARLSQARLGGADLSGADLSGADLGRADLSRAVLDGAKLDGALLIGARLCEARGKGASFVGAQLAQADLQGAELHEAAMLDIDAPESVWDKASLEGSRLLGAKLRGASFQRATLNAVCFSQADLTSACFQRAVGTAVDLRAARLEAADLRQAQLPDAKLDDADMRDVSATRADLSGARLFRAELAGANLRAAKLNGADLLHAKLDGADFRDAELQGVKIDPAAARAAKMRLPR